jgi:nucleoside-diphosphate-sugar epimerase
VKVLVAGATGAIGRPLVAELKKAGHEIAATARSESKAAQLRSQGWEAHVADPFDRDAVMRAARAAKPDAIIHQLTALPTVPTPSAMKKSSPLNARLRRETVPHFLDAARETGVKRVIVQSISFVTPPEGDSVHDETTRLWLDCPDAMFREQVEAVRDMEASVLEASQCEGIVLRYGFFYGPGTWYAPEGAMGDALRKRMLPILGSGDGLASFIHIDDAAEVTVRALTKGERGVYNVCDSEPARWDEWVPHAARCLGAPRPLHVPAFLGRIAAGRIATHYATTLRGASNAKARAAFGWSARSWREGFSLVFGVGSNKDTARA